MKIRIEKSEYVGSARCAAVDPDLYPLNGDGYIATESFDVPIGMEQITRRGARACPERVIFVHEDNASIPGRPLLWLDHISRRL